MLVEVAYGKTRLPVEIPDENLQKVFRVRHWPGLANPAQAIEASLVNPIDSAPLADIARGKKNATIVISDITRPVPNRLLLPPILQTLEGAGMAKDQILILIATGMHRPNEGDELIELVGAEIAANYRVENHFGTDVDSHVDLGTDESGVPLLVDRRYHEADLKIVTGLIEPHLIAGYSGGRKGILPGICSLETMKVMHGYRMIQQERASTGILDGNPFHETALRLAERVGCDFLVNVTLNDVREMTGVFSGNLDSAHRAGCREIEKYVVDTIDEPVDIVVTGSGGYPLDQTLYQAIKGMIAAKEILKPGGTIIFCSDLGQGLGSPPFQELMAQLDSPEGMMARLEEVDYLKMDQWMVQDFCNILLHAGEIQTCTQGLSSEELERVHLVPIDSLQSGLERAFATQGPNATVAALPDGPYVIAQVAEGMLS
ncbi:MAG: nickel-dependent lactate racemase [Candidatus Omnitrophica bacterium]|nr:nickel-dependent lactate racemase [Candidatus Omnitrophota bacterium]MCA9415165.1 nickel-dependent lactate racemase [Candidatus Omnitrophota bacterium]MCA9432155.1 nickel-dependent lactate racemase [Candidatus Omnitrophota bacterium]MCB9768847.1 nickel-dependent lactate racemase [Candidatus Omnitrophota bacterium]MCB9781693.1 nickel-dependent lactate racemase [Candidatus Omnitrophota bacterium]